MKNYNTKPEVKLQEELSRLGITYTTHKKIGLDYVNTKPDILILPNICIYVDGDYWHKRDCAIKRDAIVNRSLEKEGYIVLRFWERDINEAVELCSNEILKAIRGEVESHLDKFIEKSILPDEWSVWEDKKRTTYLNNFYEHNLRKTEDMYLGGSKNKVDNCPNCSSKRFIIYTHRRELYGKEDTQMFKCKGCGFEIDTNHINNYVNIYRGNNEIKFLNAVSGSYENFMKERGNLICIFETMIGHIKDRQLSDKEAERFYAKRKHEQAVGHGGRKARLQLPKISKTQSMYNDYLAYKEAKDVVGNSQLMGGNTEGFVFPYSIGRIKNE